MRRESFSIRLQFSSFERRLIVCRIFFLLLLLSGCAGATKQLPPPVENIGRRAARLTRGVNLSHWLTQTSAEKREDFMEAGDFSLIKKAGFRHVRLPFKPELLLDEGKTEILNQPILAYLDQALSLILAEDLAVIIDPHPAPPFKKRLDNDPAFAERFVLLWEELARHLSRYPPEMVFLEVLNEPNFRRDEDWDKLQKKLLRAMRRGAPRHTLIATGYHHGDIADLEKLKPVKDPNVLYGFHFYEPPIFTHQGADWGIPVWKYQRNIPYPSSPEKVAAILERIPDQGARGRARIYGRERWNREKLNSLLQPAVRWAHHNQRHLICDEFGVYRPAAPPADRRVWIKDVRELLERYGIGWTVWDYAGGFDITLKKGGKRELDPAMQSALGL